MTNQPTSQFTYHNGKISVTSNVTMVNQGDIVVVTQDGVDKQPWENLKDWIKSKMQSDYANASINEEESKITINYAAENNFYLRDFLHALGEEISKTRLWEDKLFQNFDVEMNRQFQTARDALGIGR
jgi:hypothetical protein